MANTSASTQVGETAELIELILSHLPTLDIVTASTVNKKFRNVVLNPVIPVILKRNLFLRATNALPQYWLPLKRCEGKTLFRAVTVDPDSVIFEPTPESSTDYHDLPLRVVSACPLLKRPSEAQGFWARCEIDSEQLEWNPCSTSPHQWYFLPAMNKPTGPWNGKKMFLTNPPCKSVRCTVMWEGWAHGVLVIALEATRHIYRPEGVTFADLLADTYSKTGPVIIRTAHDDGHWLTSAVKCGGFVCTMPLTSIHEQLEKCKKTHGALKLRLNNHSSVALLWTVALTEKESNEMAAKVEDKFFFAPQIKDLPCKTGRNNEEIITKADHQTFGW
jgi:hypothetical protein